PRFNPFQGICASAASQVPYGHASIDMFESLPGNLRFCGKQMLRRAWIPSAFQSLPGNLRFCGCGTEQLAGTDAGVSIPSSDSALLRPSWAVAVFTEEEFQSLPGNLRFCGP